MDPLVSFVIPIKGLNDGKHEFRIDIDRTFFSQFEDSPIDDAEFKLLLQLDKRPGIIVLDFHYDGKVTTDCDRCLANIQLPIDDHQQLLVKYAEEDNNEDVDVIYISPDAPRLNVAQVVYEYICLSMPMIKVYNCTEEEFPPCDQSMLTYLENKTEENEEEKTNPVWDALKNLNQN